METKAAQRLTSYWYTQNTNILCNDWRLPLAVLVGRTENYESRMRLPFVPE